MSSPELNQTQINAFKRYWKSENGKALKEYIEAFREDWLDASMRMQTPEQTFYFTSRAAAIATLVESLDLLCEPKKKEEEATEED